MALCALQSAIASHMITCAACACVNVTFNYTATGGCHRRARADGVSECVSPCSVQRPHASRVYAKMTRGQPAWGGRSDEKITHFPANVRATQTKYCDSRRLYRGYFGRRRRRRRRRRLRSATFRQPQNIRVESAKRLATFYDRHTAAAVCLAVACGDIIRIHINILAEATKHDCDSKRPTCAHTARTHSHIVYNCFHIYKRLSRSGRRRRRPATSSWARPAATAVADDSGPHRFSRHHRAHNHTITPSPQRVTRPTRVFVSRRGRRRRDHHDRK